MPGRLSVAATQACLLVGAILLFSFPGRAQQTSSSAIPAFDIQLSVSPDAAARLGSQTLRIDVNFYGSPKPGVRANTPLGFGFIQGARVQAKSQIVHVQAFRPIANITWPPRVFIRVEPPDNHVICGTFGGNAEDVVAGPVRLSCALTSEATSRGIGIGTISKSNVADSYAIYSLLEQGGALNKISPTRGGSWAVADTTVNITDMNPAVPPDGQLKAPAENKNAFEQALWDFKVRQYERFHLTASEFSGAKPDLIDHQRVQQIRDSGQGGIVFFSAVYFNSNDTAALVYVNQWCANLCSAGQWVYLEKQGGQWVRRSGTTVPGA